jgi:hypothetical protein
VPVGYFIFADPAGARWSCAPLILLLGLGSLPWYARLATYVYRFFYYHPNENVLYEVTAFDADSVLEHRPRPARNIIAVHRSAMETHLGLTMPVRKL